MGGLIQTFFLKPQSRLVQSASFGNGVNDWNTYTQDYELDVLRCDDRDTFLVAV